MQDGYPSAWQRMVAEHPDVAIGSSNRYQHWEVVDPEKWVPDGYLGVRVDSRGAGRSPGFIDPFSPRETRVFDGIAPRLARARRVTTLNLPGYGASAPRPIDSIAGYAQFLRAALDALGLGTSTDLFGNGFGAFVATEFALHHSGRIRRLVVADVNAGFPEAGRVPFEVMAGKVTEAGMAAVLDAAIGRMFPEPFQQAHPEVVTERKRRLATADPSAFARACRALAALDLSRTPACPGDAHLGAVRVAGSHHATGACRKDGRPDPGRALCFDRG